MRSHSTSDDVDSTGSRAGLPAPAWAALVSDLDPSLRVAGYADTGCIRSRCSCALAHG